MKVSFIVVNYFTETYINNLIISIQKFCHFDYEVIIVDNGSHDTTGLNYFHNVKIIQPPRNLGFGQGNNLGVLHSRGEYLIIINPDIQMTNKTNIPEMIEYLEREERVGVVSPLLVNSDQSINRNWHPRVNAFRLFLSLAGFNTLINRVNFRIPCHVGQLDGAFMLLTKNLYIKLGGFDPAYFMYYEDVDFFEKLKREGFHACLLKNYTAIHIGSVTSGKSLVNVIDHYLTSLVIFLKKWNKPKLLYLSVIKAALFIRMTMYALFRKPEDARIIKERMRTLIW